MADYLAFTDKDANNEKFVVPDYQETLGLIVQVKKCVSLARIDFDVNIKAYGTLGCTI